MLKKKTSDIKDLNVLKDIHDNKDQTKGLHIEVTRDLEDREEGLEYFQVPSARLEWLISS